MAQMLAIMQRACALLIRRMRSIAVKRRIAEHVIESLPQRTRQTQHVRLDKMHLRRHRIQRSILVGEGHEPGVVLRAYDVAARHARGEAQARDTGAGAEFQNLVSRPRRHGGCKHHSIQPRTESPRRLAHAHPPAEKSVFGNVRHAHCAWLESASFRMARARASSSSATINRRGKMTMLPSMMLMWLSNTTDGILASLRTTSAKFSSTALLLLSTSRMPLSLRPQLPLSGSVGILAPDR